MSTFTIFLVLIVVVAFLLVVVIMVQNPKGGGLASTFGGGGQQQLGGVQKTTDFLDKSTWTLAAILIGLILASNLAIDNGSNSIESRALDTDTIEQPLPETQPLPDTTNGTDDSTTND